MSLLRSKIERTRFFKFLLVGITGTIVDFGILNLFRIVFHFPLIWSQAISFFCAVINNFLWNRYWTYPDSHDKRIHHQLVQFFIINIIGILIRTPLITWLDRVILTILNRVDLNFPIENYVLSQNIALTISIVIILFWNFFANRYWTYNNVPSEVNSNPDE